MCLAGSELAHLIAGVIFQGYRMKYKCRHCGQVSEIPGGSAPANYRCGNCKNSFKDAEKVTGETSAAVGLIGGAALGASIGGPVGAIVGGILGAILGKESKGVG